jgi:L-rhamnose mutarotase
MSNNERSLPIYDSALLHNIASQVCQAIIIIQNHHPEFLLEKYRKIKWQSPANQSALITKFIELLSATQNWDDLIKKLQSALKAIFLSSAFNLPIITELITEIHQLNPHNSESLHNTLKSTKSQLFSSSFLPTGMAILLLDAENLQLHINTEKFLGTICNFPIQVKIAFANWSNRGKLDVELHERGYDLIHVPAGRDNADGKMIAFGASIHELYPNAKEVFVCSSDKVMTNLCNNLQQHGLTVYQVSQHGENINIFNNSTGENTIHSVKPLPELPSVEQFILQIKNLIKEEQKQTSIYWIKLSQLSKLYKNKYKLNISNIVSKHFPGKRARDIFINYPTDFVTHQIDDIGELYITIFDYQQIHLTSNNSSATSPNSKSSNISSYLGLEQAIANIFLELRNNSQQQSCDVSILASKFKQKYGQSITEQMKDLQIGGTFVKFLQSCKYFQVQLKDNKWEVSEFDSTFQSPVVSSEINSPTDLEQVLKMIILELTQDAQNTHIDISIVGVKFHQKYGQSITKQMKDLQISGSFIKFLQSCSSFQVQHKGNKYKVSLS